MDEEKLSYRTLIDGDIPPWVMRFIMYTFAPSQARMAGAIPSTRRLGLTLV